MNQIQEIAEFYANLQNKIDSHLCEMQNCEWESWANQKQSKLFLNYLILRKLQLLDDLSFLDFNYNEYVQKTSLIKGSCKELSHLIQLVSDLQRKEKS